MIRIHTSVITVVAILGAALAGTAAGTGGIAAAGNADDPTTFERNAAVPRQAATLGDEYFHVEWTAEGGRPGMSRLTGYVYNDYGEAAQGVELQITAVDAAGRPIRNVIQPIGDTVPARGRSYFDLQVPASSSYQLSVMSFEFVELSNGN
ncbi:MAG TPA: hypothetical protein VGT00_01975 [Methylomirabilota bacterium]|jgi:hypothetical protein|nr:hypothetical protein [Methylomirabilota bacterium]